MYEYVVDDCPVIHSGLSWEKCRDGLNCKYAHTTFERLYHPSKFRVVQCENMRTCSRGEMCAFYHNLKEKKEVEKQANEFYEPDFWDKEDSESIEEEHVSEKPKK